MGNFDKKSAWGDYKADAVFTLKHTDAEGFVFSRHFVIGVDAVDPENIAFYSMCGGFHIWKQNYQNRQQMRDDYRALLREGWKPAQP